MLRRIFKTWEIWILALFVWATVVAVNRETSNSCTGAGPIYAPYFDQFDWGIDESGGLFIARWGTFGRYDARRENGFWRVGLQFGDEFPESGNGWWWRFRVPLWLLILFLVPAITRWISNLIHGIRSLRIKEGCCRVCGYDLRATPDRCPECGIAVQNQVD